MYAAEEWAWCSFGPGQPAPSWPIPGPTGGVSAAWAPLSISTLEADTSLVWRWIGFDGGQTVPADFSQRTGPDPIRINSLDVAFQTSLIPSFSNDISNMVPASHQQNFWGRNKKNFAQGRKPYLISEKVWNKSRNIQTLSAAQKKTFCPSTQRPVQMKWRDLARSARNSNEKQVMKHLQFFVGFSRVIVKSLVGWEMHLWERGD